MKKGLKIGLIIGGAIALGVATIFIVKNIKKKKANSGGLNDGDYENENDNIGTGDLLDDTDDYVLGEWKMSYVSERPGADANLVPHFMSPRPAYLDIVKGNTVKIIGANGYDGKYTVKGVWKDSNGNAGALYLNSPNVTTANNENRTWQGKAKIQLID